MAVTTQEQYVLDPLRSIEIREPDQPLFVEIEAWRSGDTSLPVEAKLWVRRTHLHKDTQIVGNFTLSSDELEVMINALKRIKEEVDTFGRPTTAVDPTEGLEADLPWA